VKQSRRFATGIERARDQIPAIHSKTHDHQVRSMNRFLKQVLAFAVLASLAAPAVSFAKTHHHHHKYTPAKHVDHSAH
jgi:hypothetical protein